MLGHTIAAGGAVPDSIRSMSSRRSGGEQALGIERDHLVQQGSTSTALMETTSRLLQRLLGGQVGSAGQVLLLLPRPHKHLEAGIRLSGKALLFLTSVAALGWVWA